MIEALFHAVVGICYGIVLFSIPIIGFVIGMGVIRLIGGVIEKLLFRED